MYHGGSLCGVSESPTTTSNESTVLSNFRFVGARYLCYTSIKVLRGVPVNVLRLLTNTLPYVILNQTGVLWNQQKSCLREIPMVSHNADPVFASMMNVIEDELQEKSDRRYIPDMCSEVIMDNVMFFVLLLAALLNYLELVLELLIQYRCMININKNRCTGPSQDFVFNLFNI